MRPFTEDEKRLSDVRKIKLKQAVGALAHNYGPLTNAEQRFSDPTDPTSDLILDLSFGGALIRLTCPIDDDPIFEQILPENRKKGPAPIKETPDLRFEYASLMDEVRDQVETIMRGK